MPLKSSKTRRQGMLLVICIMVWEQFTDPIHYRKVFLAHIFSGHVLHDNVSINVSKNIYLPMG